MTVTDLHTFPATRPLDRRPERTVRLVRPRLGDSELPAPSVRIPHRRPHVLRAIVAAVLLGGVAILGTAWIDTARNSWYAGLSKPKYTGGAPTVLGLGWTAVCASAAVAVWLLAQRRDRRRDSIGALVAFLVQLALLLAWVWTFFVGQAIAHSFLVTLVLTVASTLTVVAFGRISKLAGVLMVPALAWAVAVAGLAGGLTVLN